MTKLFKIVNSFVIARWIKDNNQYCTGEIAIDLRVKSRYNFSNKVEELKINEIGELEELIK